MVEGAFHSAAKRTDENYMTPCLGVSWLGLCNYDPALPAPVYFTLGNAISALAFTLAVQNFLKPVFKFRLGVQYLTLRRLYLLVFAAVLVIVISTVVPMFSSCTAFGS